MVKKRTSAHVIDSQGAALFKEVLPEAWVVREYQPDYGIDFAVEVFDPQGEDFITLGELFYVQLKSSCNVKRVRKKVYARGNVEKMPLKYDRDRSEEMPVIALPLETAELQLASSMGPAAPVVLIVADVTHSEVYWVCLNDYVDKVLVPEVGRDNLRCQNTHTVHLPCVNRIGLDDDGALIPLRFLARRAKLYAAFNRFRYQRNEIAHNYRGWLDASPDHHLPDYPDFLHMVDHFFRLALAYDFWTTTHAWRIIEITHIDVKKTADEVARTIRDGHALPSREEKVRLAMYIQSTFDMLANLGNLFEEICREWFLPTFLGMLFEEDHQNKMTPRNEDRV